MKMKQLILLSIFCLLVAVHTSAQDIIVTMTTSRSVKFYVEWTGAGSIFANGELLKNGFDFWNLVDAIDGSVVLVATGGAQLTRLACRDNSIRALNFIKCAELVELYCGDNPLTVLNISKCSNLRLLSCAYASLTALDVTKCPKLEEIGCSRNSLTTLDVTKCTELTWLSCGRNLLTSLDITKCPKLKTLYADEQAPVLPEAVILGGAELSIEKPISFAGAKVSIENLNYKADYTSGILTWTMSGESGEALFRFTTELPKGISGRSLSGTATQPWRIIEPDKSQAPIVTMTTFKDSVEIYVEWAGAGSIFANGVELMNDINAKNMVATTTHSSVALTATGGARLTHLNCQSNKLSTLDVPNCMELEWLHCQFNYLSDLDVSNCPKLTELQCESNHLMALDVSNCTKLTHLYCNNNSISVLDFTNCPEFTTLECDNNSLSALDFTNCPELTWVQCESNSLITLDVSNCTKLAHLYCVYNSLSTLDVTNCPELLWLECENNSLTALDVSNCPKLITLACSYNSLSVLDVTKCVGLRILYATDQTMMLPTVEKIDDDKLRIENPITFAGAEVKIDNISHGGIYTDGNIAWEVQGESGELTFDFSAELPGNLSGRPFTGTATQPWTKK